MMAYEATEHSLTMVDTTEGASPIANDNEDLFHIYAGDMDHWEDILDYEEEGEDEDPLEAAEEECAPASEPGFDSEASPSPSVGRSPRKKEETSQEGIPAGKGPQWPQEEKGVPSP